MYISANVVDVHESRCRMIEINCVDYELRLAEYIYNKIRL